MSGHSLRTAVTAGACFQNWSGTWRVDAKRRATDHVGIQGGMLALLIHLVVSDARSLFRHFPRIRPNMAFGRVPLAGCPMIGSL